MNGVQTYRYPRLIHVFDKLGMIENFGTGIPRTIESYKNYDVKPEFKATENLKHGVNSMIKGIRRWGKWKI